MKKKLFVLLLAAAMLAGLLTGCGAASTENGYDYAVNQKAPAEDADPESADDILYGASGSTSSAQNTADQKLVKRVDMDVETEDLSQLLPLLVKRITQLGGYVENQELYNGSSYSSNRSRSAYLTVRIPADRLDDFVTDVQGNANVVRHNASQENVTLTYVATESRMNALKVEEERLLELLSKAENMTDLLEIESRLTDVRYELENITSQLRVLQNQVDYATVTLDIDQVQVYTQVEEPTVWQRITGGFTENLREIGDNLVDLFVWVVTYSPQLAILGIIAAGIILLIRKKPGKKRVSKTAENKPENEEA